MLENKHSGTYKIEWLACLYFFCWPGLCESDNLKWMITLSCFYCISNAALVQNNMDVRCPWRCHLFFLLNIFFALRLVFNPSFLSCLLKANYCLKYAIEHNLFRPGLKIHFLRPVFLSRFQYAVFCFLKLLVPRWRGLYRQSLVKTLLTFQVNYFSFQ